MKILSILSLTLGLGLASLAPSALAQEFPNTIEYSIEQKVASTTIGVGTIQIQNALRPRGWGWEFAKGASIDVKNVSTGATVASGFLDNVGNWTGTVPAGERYQIRLVDRGGRISNTTFRGIPKKGGILFMRWLRLK